MCTSVMAAREATADRQIILARNEDFPLANWNKYLVYRDVPEYRVTGTPSVADGKWTLGNGLSVPVPSAGLSYSAMPDAAGGSEAAYGIGDHFYFEERGINTANVAISATNSMTANDKAAQADPFVPVGIQEPVIPTLLLPQAETARHGVELLGRYVTDFGASEPNGLLLGDPSECWYMEIGSAHHWIAVRVPADCYVAVANGMRIHGVDLEDKGVIYSPGLFDFVRTKGLLDDPDSRSFNFARAFGILGNPYNVDREWLAQRLLTPSLVQLPRLPQYPLFLEPDRPITVADVMTVLRATYVGTVLEKEKDLRPIGYEKTAESHVITLDASVPAELSGVIWQSIGTPLGAPYMPLMSAMRHIPASYQHGANRFSAHSAYWAFHAAHALGKLAPAGQPCWWEDFEQAGLTEAPIIRTTLADTFKTDPQAAVEFAGRLSTGVAAQAVDLAHIAMASLMTSLANQAADDRARVNSAT